MPLFPLALTAEAASLSFGMGAFYTHWLEQMRIAQNPQDGSMPNYVPSLGKNGGGGGNGFKPLGLSDPVFQGVVRMGFRNPTPVQRKALPVVLTGVDTVVMARTGSGKTCAFCIPIIERLLLHQETAAAQEQQRHKQQHNNNNDHQDRQHCFPIVKPIATAAS